MIEQLTRRFDVDDVTLAWDRWGTSSDGTPFLLCHGFSGSAHDFALVVEPLSEDREVVTLDHRGHGRSTKLGEATGYSIDTITHDLIALIDAEVGGPVDLLGHSMGGAVSLRLTLARPDLVRSLILMDTSGWRFVPDDAAMAELIGGFINGFDPAAGLPVTAGLESPEDRLIADATTPEWQALKEQMATGFDPFAFKALGMELFGGDHSWIRGRLGEIVCPVTVIVGENDHPFVGQAEDLAAEVADGALTVVPGAYHSPQLTHPAEWTAAVEGHLARR